MDLSKAIEHLLLGNVILCPTDTIWGLSGDATNVRTAERIYEIKQRPKSKHFILLVANIEMLNHYVESIPKPLEDLFKKQEKPTTVIYSNPKNLPKSILADDGSIAIRVSTKPWLSNLIQDFGKPIISTSANISGQPSPRFFADITQSIQSQVDYIFPYLQDTSEANSSRIIRLDANDQMIVVRE